jgi:hypothetical protein
VGIVGGKSATALRIPHFCIRGAARAIFSDWSKLVVKCRKLLDLERRRCARRTNHTANGTMDRRDV